MTSLGISSSFQISMNLIFHGEDEVHFLHEYVFPTVRILITPIYKVGV